MTVENGKLITMEYKITKENGELIESSAGSGAPLVFICGKSGLLPGLDAKIVGMDVDEEKDFDLPPEEAFGTTDSGPTMTIAKTRLPDGAETKVGSMFEAAMPGTNQPVKFVILEDRVSDIEVRLIHPLAGETIKIWAKVNKIEDAPAE